MQKKFLGLVYQGSVPAGSISKQHLDVATVKTREAVRATVA